MSKIYCPQCGAELPEASKYCYQCGSKLPEHLSSSSTENSLSGAPVMSSSAAQQNSSSSLARAKRKRKKKNRHIAYFIFLGLISLALIYLINRKMNAEEEKPLQSLPGERPHTNQNFQLLDSLEANDTIYSDEISLLSPELPPLNISVPSPAPLEVYEEPESYNDSYAEDDYIPSPAPTPKPSLSLSTEQSVRNMLISNRFVDPTTSEVITFTNNGNVLMKDGEAQTSEMEISTLSGNNAILNFYDDNNNSWDVSLDISGDTKRLKMMDNTYISN